MSRTVLIVEGNDARRHAVKTALAARGVATFEVHDAFAGLAALGRADFGAIVLAEGRRTLSLKGLTQLARKRHEGIKLYVILSASANAERIRAQLGDDIIPVPPDWSVEKLGGEVALSVESADEGAKNPWRGESEPGRESGKSTPSAVDLGPAPVSVPAALSLEGTLDDGEGPALLMGLFSQGLTGSLEVERDGRVTTIVLCDGEPAWAKEANGDVAIHRRLVAKGLLPPDARIDAVADGELFAALVRAGRIGIDSVTEVLREVIKDVVFDLSTATDGTYRFLEDRSFNEIPPLCRINPFGLIFDSRRRTWPPDRLVALAGEMSQKHICPGPALRSAASKLKPFVRDKEVSDLIDGRRTVEEFTNETGLDHLMGALMVLTLVDARLARLSVDPMSMEDSMVMAGAPMSAVDVRSSGPTFNPDASDDEKRDFFRHLYMRVRSLTQPTQVLGLPLHAGRDDIRRAYEARLEELETSRVPQGPDHGALCGMLDELRAKVEGAHEALRIQQSMSGTESVPGVDVDSNPF